MPASYVFHLDGKIKPYVRMTQRSKMVETQALEYIANKQALQYQFKSQMQHNNWDMLPKGALSLKVDYTVAERLHGFDLDNVVKAIADAMQEIVIENDLWIDEVRARRQLGEAYGAVVTIGLV